MTDAREYGRALFELAEESANTEKIFCDICLLKEAFANNPEYKNLLDTPALSKEEKLSLIDEAFAGIDVYALNLIKILCECHSVHIFGEIAQAFADLYDEALSNGGSVTRTYSDRLAFGMKSYYMQPLE